MALDPLTSIFPLSLLISHRWAAACLSAVAAFAFLNSLANGFAFDDRGWIVQSLLVRDFTNIRDIFSSPYVPKEFGNEMYRPLLTLSYALNYAVSGLRPFSYHLVNVLLHAGNSALVYALTWQLFRQRGLAWLTAAAFALHPIHTEAVANVVGRSEPLAAAFVLLAWLFYLRADDGARGPRPPHPHPLPHRGRGLRKGSSSPPSGGEDPGEGAAPLHREGERREEGARAVERSSRTTGFLRAASVTSFALALLSKESAIVLPGLLFLGDALRITQRRPAVSVAQMARHLGRRLLTVYPRYLAIAGGYLVVRMIVLGTMTMPGISPVMNPIAFAGTSTRLFTALTVLHTYLLLLVVPSRLSADYSYNQIPLVTSPLEPGVWLPLLGAVAVGWMMRRRAPAVPFGLLVFFVTILPVSNIFFPIGTIMGERLAYLPSLGFCLALAGAVVATVERLAPRRLAWVPLGAFGLLLAVYAGRTVIRNPVWATDLALWRAAVAASPNSAKAHLHLASALIDTGDLDEARQSIEAALRIFPTWVEVQREAALIRQMQGPWDGAIAEHQALVRSNPYAPEPHDRLARVYEAEGFLLGARRAFQRAGELAFHQDKPHLHLGIGDFLVRYDKLPEAESSFERTVATWPRFVNGHLYLGYVYWKRGRLAEARTSFDRALRLDPDSPKGHEGLGLILRSQGREAEARREFELAGELARRAAGVMRQPSPDAVVSPDSDQL